MGKTYIVDGNSLLFRCFFSTFRPGAPLMTAKDGTPTNALHGFAQMIGTIRKGLKEGERMVVCFDTGHPTHRSKEIEGYKAQRKPIEPALKAQIPLAHQMLDEMGIERAEMEGYEGDDVAGSLTKYAQGKGDEVVLFTSDKDFLQLLDDRISVHALKKGLTDVEVYTKDNVAALFGCRADQVVDFKAIAGDSSDNYKGIPGIGEKTALKLLSEYPHLEDILEAYRGDEKTALGKKLNAGAEQGRLCRKIASIDTDLPVSSFYDASLVKPADLDKLKAFYLRYDLRKLASSLGEASSSKRDSGQMTLEEAGGGTEEESALHPLPKAELSFVGDVDAMDAPPASLTVALDGKLRGWNENTSKILGFVMASQTGRLYFLKAELVSSAKGFLAWLRGGGLRDSLDSKSTIVSLSRLGVEAGKFDYDFLLASYLIDSDRASDLEEALAQLGYACPEDPIERIAGATSVMEQTKEKILQRLSKEQQLPLLNEVELPLAKTLADMEIEGMPLDVSTLQEIGTSYKKVMAELVEKIYDYAGGEAFNVDSPSQVSEILFGKLGLVRAKGEKGSSVEVLNNHVGDHPIVALILAYRTFAKIVNGYVDALPGHVCPSDGKIHAIVHQTLTSTGRLSMSEPNLQNISIRKEQGKELRKAFFYPDENYEFLSLDYSQVELRVLASLGDVPELKKVCAMDEDIHKATASLIFGVPLDEVDAEMRRKAKTVNFGIVYGISTHGLAERLGIPFGEAKEFIGQFFKTFPGIKEYQKREVELAKKQGYVSTVDHRRRYFPGIDSPSYQAREASERAAVNAAIQGSAADLIKVAMNQVAQALEGKHSKLVLQIHDELVFKIYKPEKEELFPLLSQIMEQALSDKLGVRLKVEGNAGRTWFDCK